MIPPGLLGTLAAQAGETSSASRTGIIVAATLVSALATIVATTAATENATPVLQLLPSRQDNVADQPAQWPPAQPAAA